MRKYFFINSNSAKRIINTAQLRRRSIDNIFSINTINAALPHISKNSLVVLDLDNTLIKPSNTYDLGSDQWFNSLLNHAKKLLGDNDIALKYTIIIRNEIHDLISMELVEQNTLPFLNKLYKDNYMVLIMTLRGKCMINITEKQLNDLNININYENDIAATIQRLNATGNKLVYFSKGILYCNGVDKGNIMRTLLNHHLSLFRRIVMIDDRRSNLISVKNELLTANTHLIGLHYNVLKKRIAHFDLNACHLEMAKYIDHLSITAKQILKQLELIN